MRLPASLDLVIVGAGPQALTLATFLAHKKFRSSRWLAVDPSGTWLEQWRQQFARQQISALRSPAVHHPDPNPFALRQFAATRPGSLHPPYDRPGTNLFNDFCAERVQHWQLGDRVYPAQVLHLLPPAAGRGSRFHLQLSDGCELRARRVVLALGGGRPVWPAWARHVAPGYPPDRLRHEQQVDLRGLSLAGEQVLLVGGGLSSGHLALGAIARGAQVTLLRRRVVPPKLFDADPSWLGPKALKAFQAEPDWSKRYQQLQAARDGGSLTPSVELQLRRAAREGALQWRDRCELVAASWQAGQWRVHTTAGETLTGDHLWLATGTSLDAGRDSLLQPVLAAHPTLLVGGLPVLDEYLRWPGCELMLMGGYAALQLGPVARNLAGARMASDRLVRALTKPSLARITL